VPSLGADTNLGNLFEHHAVEKRVNGKAGASELDSRSSERLARSRAEPLARCFPGRPEAGYGDASTGDDIGGRKAWKPRQWCVHRSVDVAGRAAGGIEMHHAEHAESGGHVRLDHGLGERRRKDRIDSVAAVAQYVRG